MHLFCSVPELRPENAFVYATHALVDAIHALPPYPARSLCELLPDEEDYQWLCGWAKTLPYFRPCKFCLTGDESGQPFGKDLNLTWRGALGLFFLLFASERARREATEGHLWSHIHQGFSRESRGILFHAGNQPSRELAAGIEEACRILYLRHDFDQKEHQYLYRSVFLQFGFTRAGLMQLPNWLSGHQTTETISWLLDGHTPSLAFRTLWINLREYRRNNVGEPRMRAILEDSPWILEDWIDGILLNARSKAALGTCDDFHLAPLPFLSPPRLVWEAGSKPVWHSTTTNLATLDLQADSYDILLDGVPSARIINTGDQGYQLVGDLILDGSRPEYLATLLDDQGQAVDSIPLIVWNQEDDIDVWDLRSGQ
jgi:hypothetical protein